MATTQYYATALIIDGQIEFCVFEDQEDGHAMLILQASICRALAATAIAAITTHAGLNIPSVVTDSATLASKLLNLGQFAELTQATTLIQ